jgi:CPA2 family monovalent cation:H+ antiporter-2
MVALSAKRLTVTQLHILRDLVVLFGAALVVVLVLRRLRLPTIAGFLVAGALIGPSGVGWIRDAHEIESLAEIGVVLLLFTIGLEFSLKELRRLGPVLVVGGGLQVTLTVLAVTAGAVLAGFSPFEGIFFGFLAALSSTAIVLKGLAERGATDAPHGRLIVGVLLFQDLCVVPMMLLVPMLAGRGGGALAVTKALGMAALVVVATLLLARRAVPRALHLVALSRSRDLFVLAVVVICAGIAWLTSLAGLSLALGAFLAGIVLADSEYAHQAFTDVLPLREIFTSLFFVSMGMLLDVRVLAAAPGSVFGLVGALLVGKALLATVAGLAARFPAQVALVAGLALGQVGEFSFVLASLGRRFGLLDATEMRVFVGASVITMLVSPFALRFGPSLAARAGRLRALDRLLGRSREELSRVPAGLSGHVVVLGFGVGGEMLGEVLRGAEIPFAILDINAERVVAARRRGEPVYYGDVTSPDILERARVGHARQVAILLNDPTATLRAVRTVRRLAPGVPILARARYVADVPVLLQAGATVAVAQEYEASLKIISEVMKRAPLGAAARDDGAETARQLADAAVPAGAAVPPASSLVARLPSGLEVESLPVHEQAWIAGRTLAEARLRARTGATLVAVSRGESTAVHPSPEDVLEVGDVVCLVGSALQIAAARELLEAGPKP